jgi:hypothetical protein
MKDGVDKDQLVVLEARLDAAKAAVVALESRPVRWGGGEDERQSGQFHQRW